MSTRKQQEGITLVEMMVVVFIIILLTGAVTINYKKAQRQLALERTASKLAQDIRRAQEMAMSAKKREEEEEVPKGGYGVCVLKGGIKQEWEGKYFIYGDTGEDTENYSSYASFFLSEEEFNEELVEEVPMEKGVIISGLNPIECAYHEEEHKLYVCIDFEPPDPKVHIKNYEGDYPLAGGAPSWSGDCESVEITLSLKEDSTKTKTVKVNKAGLIYVK